MGEIAFTHTSYHNYEHFYFAHEKLKKKNRVVTTHVETI